MVAQFECQVGSMYSAELEQSAEGTLSVKVDSLKFIDQASEFGGYVHCAGQTTPWQSHLGSEEYEPNAKDVEAALVTVGNPLTGSKYYDEVALFYSTAAERGTGFVNAKTAGIQRMSPYFYGWTPEVKITNAAGDSDYTKHYAMGRFSHELSYVMPDKRTVYMSDDGTNVGLFMFIADQEMDLSAGTLYAAKWIQTSDAKGGRALLDWVNLGHTDNATVKAEIDKDLSYSDVFESAAPTGTPATDCATGFTFTPSTQECLKVKDIDGSGTVDATDKAIASRLETRRYASMMGATTEFRKEEGITYNADQNKLYVAMSSIGKGMEDMAKYGDPSSRYDGNGNNDIRLPYNPCGAVYELDMLPSKGIDTAAEVINSRFVASNMKAIITRYTG